MSYRPTRPARSSAPAIARASAGVFRDLAQRTKFMDPALAERWPQLAGEKLAALCRPGRLTGRGLGRTLELYVPHGAAAAAAEMERDGLIARLNAYLGPGSVSRIAIIQTGKAPKAPTRPAAGKAETAGGDVELGAALASFRAAIHRRNGGK